MTNNIPQLRFTEFTGDWEKKTLGEMSSNVSYGMNAAAIEFDGENKYIRITDIDESSRTFISSSVTSPSGIIEEKFRLKQDDIVFARTGASVGKSYLYNTNDGKLYFAGFLIKASINKANSKFVFLNTLRQEYNKWVKVMSMRSGQPGINAVEYKSFKISIPSITEQTKIADFLTAVDKRINLLEEKKKALEKYKKGVMQKVFDGKWVKVDGQLKFQPPTIRFKNEDGNDFPDWEEKKLGKVCENIGGTALENFFSTFGSHNVVSIGNYTPEGYYNDNNQRIVLNDKTKTKLLDKDDLVMVLNDKTSTGDIIGATILIPENNQYIYNQRSERLICNTDIVLPVYLWIFLNSPIFRKNVFSISQGGTQIYVNFSAVKKLQIHIPRISEQQKIADFLSSLDGLIEKVDRQINLSQEWKKGLLQKMFV
jgi:type I restriction enzyme S subunit